jgi:hypothetical protein
VTWARGKHCHRPVLRPPVFAGRSPRGRLVRSCLPCGTRTRPSPWGTGAAVSHKTIVDDTSVAGPAEAGCTSLRDGMGGARSRGR